MVQSLAILLTLSKYECRHGKANNIPFRGMLEPFTMIVVIKVSTEDFRQPSFEL